ncbi:uroporphyrinogen-III C-methyltransferase [Sanguibacter gelidistatuariae]|uniref:Uroporphyrinogen-III C-methyltransferase n=1 Tax=Sanguibacter gelidistatuariae TaxID=1814289 RepID=A0A1G6KQY8_9MICO|nr:uroporphyrinogen-III C-methyltransferase [Sanguibacter gelidistatuariae]SDC33373.1 uroporphyrinogen-III C-methyltransferase [Sanguibacter gelidistatuariae]
MTFSPSLSPALSVDILPLGLRVTGRRVVLVGGGPVSARRAQTLADAGARLFLVAPGACSALATLVASGAVAWEQRREYAHGDLAGAWLVHVATGDPAVDAQVSADAEAQQTFCVAAGDGEGATAWVPAVARVGDSVVSVTSASVSDRNPRRSIRVRDAIEASLRTGTLPVRATPPRSDGPAGGGASRMRTGSVALVGGGPGALDLLTVRGRNLITAADVVVIDRLAPRAILDELPADVEIIDVGKTSGHHPIPQDEINAILVERALAGYAVVRLKGGDPYVFGRGGEELDACVAAGIPVEVVPGVTSAISVPAAAGIPVTHRGLSRGFTILTGHEDVGRVPAASDHTVVLLMGVAHLPLTTAGLLANGRDPETPAAIIEDGYGPRQRTTVGTLATIAARAVEAGVRPPAITVIGDVVRRAPEWVK